MNPRELLNTRGKIGEDEDGNRMRELVYTHQQPNNRIAGSADARTGVFMKTKTFDQLRTDETRALQIWQILIAKADARQVITYEILSKYLGYKGAGVLARQLGHIMYYCDQNDLPPLTALVVNKRTGLPGEGLINADDLPEIHKLRERVFGVKWYRLVPPTPAELAEAYRKG